MWRVFYTTAKSEKRSERYLRDRGVISFVPTMEVVRQWSDRKKIVVEPLFRNYLFARVNESERIRVLQTPGIVRCLAYSGSMVTVSDEDIARIKHLEFAGPHLEVIQGRLPEGMPVVVTAGPMQGLKGELVEYRGQRRVVVNIDSIQRVLSIILPRDWVRAEAA